MGGDGDDKQELRVRARRLADDLNLSTLGWRIPSDRLVEDFAAGEHRLEAREHELVELGPGGERGEARRVFALHAPGAAGDEGLVALLVEPARAGAWRLLVPDERR